MADQRRNPIRIAEWRRQHLAGSPHKILCDAEVEAFVNASLPTMTFREIARACVEKFGTERAPSASSVHRYWCEFFRATRPEQHRRKRRRKPRGMSAQPGERTQ